MVPLYVGWDRRESVAFHVFVDSVIEHSRTPVRIIPLAEHLLDFDGQRDGSNAFIYSRYLVPFLQGYKGFAIFCDGDMLIREGIEELWSLRDPAKAVQVVQHDYQTQHPRKYVGSPLESDNIDYPRKNWSSVILWNCGHPSNRILTREFVSEAGGAILHRFDWLDDNEIGSLPKRWNGLCEEQDASDAALLHYTVGVPGFGHYARCDHHRPWNKALMRMLHLEGERPEEMVRRAAWRS